MNEWMDWKEKQRRRAANATTGSILAMFSSADVPRVLITLRDTDFESAG